MYKLLFVLILSYFLLPVYILAQTATPDTVNFQYVENLLSSTESSLQQFSNDFIETWNTTAVSCQEAKGKVFGNMSSPCRKIRAAIRQGEFQEYVGNCVTEWSSALNTVKQAPILSVEFEDNMEGFTRLFSGYNETRMDYCFIEKFKENSPALYSFFEDAINARGNDFANFSNVDLMKDILDGQRIYNDSNFEQEQQRRRELQAR